jgi:chromatin remodeling complex protein RSC6
MAARARSKPRSSRTTTTKSKTKTKAKRTAPKQQARTRAKAKASRSGGGGGLKQPVKPDEALAAVVGSRPMPRTQLVSKFWDYVKSHKLQAANDRRKINADERLRPLFGGKRQISMFEVTRLLVQHAH